MSAGCNSPPEFFYVAMQLITEDLIELSLINLLCDTEIIISSSIDKIQNAAARVLTKTRKIEHHPVYSLLH